MSRDYVSEFETIFNSIPWAPYARDKSDGVTQDLVWRGETYAVAGQMPTSMCVGAILELIHNALKRAGYEKRLSAEQVKQLKQHVFIEDVTQHIDGVAGALCALGLASKIEYWQDAKAGDFAQIWDYNANGERVFGHSVLLMGDTVNPNTNAPAFRVWSSDPTNGGHSWDWFTKVHPKSDVTRVWHIARPTF